METVLDSECSPDLPDSVIKYISEMKVGAETDNLEDLLKIAKNEDKETGEHKSGTYYLIKAVEDGRIVDLSD